MALNETDRELALFVLQNNMLDAQSVRHLGSLAEQRQSSFYQVLLDSQQLTQSQLSILQSRLPASSVSAPNQHSVASSHPSTENYRPTAKLESSRLQDALIQVAPVPPSVVSHSGSLPPPSTSAYTQEPGRSQSASSIGVGSSLGPYKLISELGKGGMGVVYKAHHTALDKLCALKVLIAGKDAPSEVLQRFIAEAKLAAKLEAHPNIVRVLDSGVLDNHYFMSMELIEGSSLATLLEQKKVSHKAGARVVQDMAHALAYAHSFGIIHRDVKPQNVLIDRQSKAHLSDFGVAKASDGEDGFTTTGALVGTLSYMAPEQAEDAKHIDATADVYALGAILYHVLCDRPPHTGVTHTNILMSLATKTPPLPRSINPKTDRLLEAICLKAIEKDPSKRYQSADELAKALEDFRSGQHSELNNLAKRQTVQKKRSPALWFGVTGAVVLLAILGFLFSGGDPAPADPEQDVTETPAPKTFEVLSWLPQPGHLVNQAQVTVEGRVDPEIQKVRAAKQTGAVIDGRFSLELALSEGENEIPFEFFRGQEERPAFRTNYRLQADFTKPKVRLENLPRASKIGEFVVRGRCEDRSKVKLRCQDFQKTLSGPSFEFAVTIRSGPNHFALHAVDQAGNETMTPFTILGESQSSPTKAPQTPPQIASKKQDEVKKDEVKGDNEKIQKDKEDKDEKKNKKNKKDKKSKKKEFVRLISPYKKDQRLEEEITLVFKVDPEVDKLKWDGVSYDTDGKETWEIQVRPSRRDRKWRMKVFVGDKKVQELKLVFKASKRLKLRPILEKRDPLLGTVKLAIKGSRFVIEATLPQDSDGTGYPKLYLPSLKKSVTPNRSGRVTLRCRHSQILRGLTGELRYASGQVERRELVRPMPILHSMKLWQRFSMAKSLKVLNAEIELARKLLAADFEAQAAKVYTQGGLRFYIASFRHRRTGIVLHLVPGGRFNMGSVDKASEQPMHEVKLRPFLIGRSPIEGEEFYFTYAPKKLAEKRKKEGGRPIDEMSFERVCRFLDYSESDLRLPSESEWEYAARAGSETRYFWGDDFDPNYCWYSGNSEGRRLRLVKHQDKFNAFGLIDMLGHVAEWVADSWEDNYQNAPRDGSPLGRFKDKNGVVRGGAIGGKGRDSKSDCRSAARHKLARKEKKSKYYDDVGFRVAHDLPIPKQLP